MEFLDKINGVNVHTLQVFDFSTLYTSLDHREILRHIFELLDLVFNSHSRKYICIGWDKAFFSKKNVC